MHIPLRILAHTCQICILPRHLFSGTKEWPAGKMAEKTDKEFLLTKIFFWKSMRRINCSHMWISTSQDQSVYLGLVRKFCWVIFFFKNLQKMWLDFQFLVHWWNNSDNKPLGLRNLINEENIRTHDGWRFLEAFFSRINCVLAYKGIDMISLQWK